MRSFFTVFLLFLLCQVFPAIGLAQPERHFNVATDDISLLIPPLNVLIDSAIANNPGLKSSDLQVIRNNYTLRSNMNYWTRNLSVQADIRYGNFNNYSSTNSSDVSVSSNRSELRYGIGGSIKFPIYDFLDRKNQVKVAKTEVDIARTLVEEKQVEVRKAVIKQYNDLILKQRLMKLATKNITTAKINMTMAEKEFLNGVIPLSEYSRISDNLSKTSSEFENLRMEFLTTYMILEEIVGMKFNLTNAILNTDESN